MTESTVQIKIPEQLIQDTIRAEMVRTLGNYEAIVNAVVNRAFTAKKDTYSSTPTIFQEEVEKMIRDEATLVFREWLDENKDVLKKAMYKELSDNRGTRLKQLCSDLVDGLMQFRVSVSLYAKESR